LLEPVPSGAGFLTASLIGGTMRFRILTTGGGVVMLAQLIADFSGTQNGERVEIGGSVNLYLLLEGMSIGMTSFQVEALLDPTRVSENPILRLVIRRGSETVLIVHDIPLEGLSSMAPRDLFVFNLFLGLLTVHVTQREDHDISTTLDLAEFSPPSDTLVLNLLREWCLP